MADTETYSITRGGPLYRLERLLRISRDDEHDLGRRTRLVIVLAYGPILAMGIGWRVATGDWPRALNELETHVRVLVTLPLLLFAELFIEDRASAVGNYLLRSRLVGPDAVEGHRLAIAHTARLRDSRTLELALLAAMVVSLFAVPSPSRENERWILWSLQPGILIYRFLFFRLLWRWCLWALYLRRFSRLPLALRATHPDRVAGLSPLAGPSITFSFLAMAGASSAAASWGDRMRLENVAASAFTTVAITYIVVAVAFAAAPLWVFTFRLVRMRKEGVYAYGALANRYSEAFERRWFDSSGEDALGTPDLQSLNDLGGSFERVQQMHTVVAPRAMLVMVVVGAALPMLPLIVAEVGATTLLVRLGKAML
jgi:hypothetical protein